MIDTSQIDLVNLIGTDTSLKRVASTNGGEYAGPCPFCGGHDRFRVWPAPPDGRPRYWCRQCNRHGDAIQYLRDRDGSSFRDACALLGLTRPCSKTNPHQRTAQWPMQQRFGSHREPWDALNDPKWQEDAKQIVRAAARTMNGPQGKPGREYCDRRGLTDEIIADYRLGYNPAGRAITVGSRRRYFPQGIIIPWFGPDETLWKVNVRRLDGRSPKYQMVGGSANGLFGVSEIRYGARVVMVEAEFCAMSLRRATGGSVTPVATGSVTGSRLTRWIGHLTLADQLILAFDDDQAGDIAAAAWQECFPEAIRLRPVRKDVNEMLVAGDDIVLWLESIE